MAILTAGSVDPVRMDLLDIGSLYSSGTVTSASSTAVSFDIGGGYVERLTGLGLTYGGTGSMTGGTITGLVESYNGTTTLAVSGFSVAATDFYGWAVTQNTSGALAAIFAGNDQFTGGGMDDFMQGYAGHDYLAGGAGADTLLGGDGNDHIYGQSANGGLDGPDLLMGGNGDDYVQGNAGNDTIYGGDGFDRLNGGADNDLIFGENGDDTINGNLGNDTIDGGLGNDFLRGGQGDDLINGYVGNDVIMGDLGNDTIIGGMGIDQMTGGAGADVFRFAAGDAAFATDGPFNYWPDAIMDYTPGTDHLDLGFTVSTVLTGTATDVAGAAGVAQALMSAHGGIAETAAVQVGHDTYLFWSGSGNSDHVDSAVELVGVQASAIHTSDFV